jgi:hypothetical protein
LPPRALAILETSEAGPVRIEVPESTIALCSVESTYEMPISLKKVVGEQKLISTDFFYKTYR